MNNPYLHPLLLHVLQGSPCQRSAQAWHPPEWGVFVYVKTFFSRLENLRPGGVAGKYHDVPPLSDAVILTNVHSGLEMAKKGKNPGEEKKSLQIKRELQPLCSTAISVQGTRKCKWLRNTFVYKLQPPS